MPASRRDNDSFVQSEREQRGVRNKQYNSQQRAHSQATIKETPKGNRGAKRPVPENTKQGKTLEHFYAVQKEQGRGGQNSLFSPVLSNMHKDGGVQVRAKNDNVNQQTMKISSATKQKPTKIVNTRKGHQTSPKKNLDALITPVLS